MLNKRLGASIGILLFVAALFFFYGQGSPLAYVLILIPVVLGGIALFTMCDHTVVFLLGILLLGNLSYSQRIPDAIPMLLAFLSAGCGWTALFDTQKYKNWNLLFFGSAALVIWFEALVLSGNPFDSMILMHHVCALLFVIFVATCRSASFRKILIAAKIYLLFLSVFGCIEFAFFFKPRLEGPFFSATAYAATLVALFALLAFSSVFAKKFTLFNVALGLVALFVILMTGTRSAILAVGLILALMVPLFPGMPLRKKVIIQVVAISLILVGGVLLWQVLPDTLKVKQTFGTLDVSHKQVDGSSMGRLVAWWIVFKIASAHPLMGIGIGQFPKWAWKSFPVLYLPHAHNIFFNALAETGAIGESLLFLMIGSVSTAVWKIRDKIMSGTLWGTGMAALLMGQLDNMPLYPTTVFWGAMLCGLALRKTSD